MLYVDPLAKHGFIYRQLGRGKGRSVKSCHMFSDENSKGELFDMAELIGMRPRWIQKSNIGLWHFDLMQGKRKEAIENGVIEVSRREAVEIWKEMGLIIRSKIKE